MTKADFIRKLASQGFTDLQILVRTRDKFGFCNSSYVRICARQRVSGSSEHDRRYSSTPLGKARKRRHTEKTQDARNASSRALYSTADLDATNAAGRKAYRRARLDGKTKKEALQASSRARSSVIHATGSHKAARQAYAQARVRSAALAEGAGKEIF